MRKFFSILLPIITIVLIVAGTYFYINSGSNNYKEEHSKYISLINDDHDFSSGLKGLQSLTTEKAKDTLKNIDKEIEIATQLNNIDTSLKNSNIELAEENLSRVNSLDSEKTFEKAIIWLNTEIENHNKAVSEISELDISNPNYQDDLKKIVDKYNFNYSSLRAKLLDTNNENAANHTQSDNKKSETKKTSNDKNKENASDNSKATTSAKSNTQVHPRIIGQQVPETYNTIRYTQEGSTSRNIVENELKGDISNFTNEQIDQAIASYNAKNGG